MKVVNLTLSGLLNRNSKMQLPITKTIISQKPSMKTIKEKCG